MTRLLLENHRRPGRGGGSTEADTDEGRRGRAAASINDDTAGARLRHPEDPSGRRSLTGIEFRRLRSI